MSSPAPEPAKSDTFLERLVVFISVLGGLVVLMTAIMVTTSVSSRWVFAKAIPGDFEFAQMGTAIAVFAFLPVCQARRGNIVVDTFTGFLSPRACQLIDGLWDLVYAACAGFITYCMVLGTLETYRSGATTMMLQLPTWPALLVSTILIGLLTVVTCWTGLRMLGGRS